MKARVNLDKRGKIAKQQDEIKNTENEEKER